MNEIGIYGIVISCLSFSAVYSIVNCFILIRKNNSVEKSNDLWCGLINTVCVYGTFITLYANRYFAQIYDYIYDQYDLFTSECVFLLIIMLVWIVAGVPSAVLSIVTNQKPLIALKGELYDIVWKLLSVFLFGGYILLVVNGPIWAMLPAALAILVVTVIILKGVIGYKKVITVKLLLWFAAISTTFMGLAFIAYYLTDSYILSSAMDIYPVSIVANLLSVIFVSLPLIDIIEPLYKRYEPQWYIPMINEEIDKCKVNKREESLDKEEVTNDTKEWRYNKEVM